jgi:hypothetical protein
VKNMRCAAILDGVVQNTIEIGVVYKAGFERASGMKLIEIGDDMNVQTGDLYDEENKVFIRDGVEVSKDSTIAQLVEKNAELLVKLATLETANAELTENNDMLTACILEMSEIIYA